MSPTNTEIAEALVVAALAVNNYGLEKAWELLPRLHDRGFLDAEELRQLDDGELTIRLAQAGYDRGMLTEMMAKRVRDLVLNLDSSFCARLTALVSDMDAAVAALCELPGVGPHVARQALLLLGVK